MTLDELYYLVEGMGRSWSCQWPACPGDIPPAELRRMTELFFPEERRHEFTPEPWDGVSFRHYHDPKVVCLEHYRPEDRPILLIGCKPAA